MKLFMILMALIIIVGVTLYKGPILAGTCVWTELVGDSNCGAYFQNSAPASSQAACDLYCTTNYSTVCGDLYTQGCTYTY